jgi:hypothetical protein
MVGRALVVTFGMGLAAGAQQVSAQSQTLGLEQLARNALDSNRELIAARELLVCA